MEFILVCAAIAGGVLIARLFEKIGLLQRQIDRLEGLLSLPLRSTDAPPPATPDPERSPDPRPRRSAVVVRAQPEAAAPPPSIAAPFNEPLSEPESGPESERPRREPIRLNFETIVGGKLPIWIGGAALVLAAFFLVRFSIENGLLGPRARTIVAGIFGLALIAASEVSRRLPATRSDPRVGQSLAGAGVASLYGTLYVAAQIYGLIGALPAFAAMILITAAGLALALRHGPPTAIMALIGGFAAPLIAGFESAGIGPLLVYLGLLVAALFGLAIRRGWAWLALAACGGGFAWVNLLIASLGGNDLAGVGSFVLLLAIGATLALPRTGADQRWIRLLPLLAGLVQLLALAPALDFGPLAWGLYLVLSAAALWLGWRDEALAPGGAAALALILVLLGLALDQGDRTNAPLAAIATTLLFAGVGHWRLRGGSLWAGVALGGSAGPLLLCDALAHALLPPLGWVIPLTFAAALCGWASWRARDKASAEFRPDPALTGGAALATLLAAVALYELLPIPWLWPAWIALGVALAAWSRRIGDATIGMLALAPAIGTLFAVILGLDHLFAYFNSVFTAAPIPPVAELIALGLLPPLLLAATAQLLTERNAVLALRWVAWVLLLGLIRAALPAPWHAVGLALATVAAILLTLPLAGAAQAALLTTAAAALPTITGLILLALTSVSGDRFPYLALPPLLEMLRNIALPATLVAAALTQRRDAFGKARAPILAGLAIMAIATFYALAKQPLAIATPEGFESIGLLERAVLTQITFLAAFLLRARAPRLSLGLFALALFRFVWFDLLLLDPLLVKQSVGSIPLLNLATFHAGLTAFWLWRYRTDRRFHAAALIVVLLAVGVTVRQATHGAFLTGSMSRTENWLYSASLLGLALVWLARGITGGIADLRVAGLALLTGVTLKVFLIDAAALEGILRILSFLGLGLALIGIGWAYGRVIATGQAPNTQGRST